MSIFFIEQYKYILSYNIFSYSKFFHLMKKLEHIKVMMKLISMFSKNVNSLAQETAVILTMMLN